MNFRKVAGLNLSNSQGTLIALFVISFLCHGVFVLTMRDGFYFADSVDYWAAAVRLLTNGEFGETYQREPVYLISLAGIHALFTQSILAVRIVEALMGAGLVVLIAIMARRMRREQVGGLAGLLWSIYPLGIFVAGLVYPTGVATKPMVISCSSSMPTWLSPSTRFVAL